MSILTINITFAPLFKLTKFAKNFDFDSEQLELMSIHIYGYLEFCH